MQNQADSAFVLRRIAAYVIDFIILIIPLAATKLAVNSFKPLDDGSIETLRMRVVVGGLSSLASILVACCYFAYLESSAAQSTFGKRLFGLKVINLEGARISFPRAIGRFFARVISLLTFGIGLFIAPLTASKQALHDLLTKTRVTKSDS
ncbi:MAG: RDD family protein [Verrucomicrobiota bacterium]|nr:RDD family protein [Verrucomicrobiota bacterium]